MRRRLLGAAVLGVCLMLSALIFGIFFYRGRQPAQTIRVVGAATQRLTSDTIKWRVTFTRNTGISDLKAGYAQIEADTKAFVELIEGEGIGGENVAIQPANLNPIYGQYEKSGTTVGYNLTQSAYLISHDLAKVEKIALSPKALVDKGIILQGSNLEYYYSKLSDLKRALLAEATRDAKRRAEEIAKSTGDRIGKIESARAGVFQITEPFSTEVSDYGMYNTFTKEKDVTITVNVTFNLG